MNIALLAPLRFPIAEPFHGGLEMHTHLLARELDRCGHSITVFGHPDSEVPGKLIPIQVGEKAGILRQVFAYREAMEKIRKGHFDAVHNNSIHFLPPLLAGGLKCPMVTTLHTPPYRSLRWGGRYSRAKNHQFVSISHYLHGVWEPHIGKHEVVHNGIYFADWPFSETAATKTAVWYGRFTPEKGAEYAIAAARAAGYRLTLAGPIYDQSYFDEKVRPELDETIRYAGHLNQQELAALIGASSVGLVTSVWDEPFGLVYIEMPACGTPVVAFDSGAAREIITEATGAIVPKHDIGALTQVLGEVKGKVRSDVRAAAEQNFSVGKMAEGYLRLLAL